MSTFKVLNLVGFSCTRITLKDNRVIRSIDFIYPNSLDKVGIKEEDVKNIAYVSNTSGVPYDTMTKAKETRFINSLLYTPPFVLIEGTNKWTNLQ